MKYFQKSSADFVNIPFFPFTKFDYFHITFGDLDSAEAALFDIHFII
jgi:hypothetical protein